MSHSNAGSLQRSASSTGCCGPCAGLLPAERPCDVLAAMLLGADYAHRRCTSVLSCSVALPLRLLYLVLCGPLGRGGK